jgi:hypothetical protein
VTNFDDMAKFDDMTKFDDMSKFVDMIPFVEVLSVLIRVGPEVLTVLCYGPVLAGS